MTHRNFRVLAIIAATAMLASPVVTTAAMAQPASSRQHAQRSAPDNPGQTSAYFAGYDLYPEEAITSAHIQKFKVPELDCTNGGGQLFGLGHATAPFSNAVLGGLDVACGGGTAYYQTIAEACGSSDIGGFASVGDK